MNKYLELMVGVGLGLIVYLVWSGVDLTPLLLLAAAGGALFLLNQGRLGHNFETVGNQSVIKAATGVNFEDIGGQEMAKRELLEALDFVSRQD